MKAEFLKQQQQTTMMLHDLFIGTIRGYDAAFRGTKSAARAETEEVVVGRRTGCRLR